MRRGNDAGVGDQRREARRLDLEDVGRVPADLPVVERGEQGGFVDEARPRRVDDAGAAGEPSQPNRVEQRRRAGIGGRVERDDRALGGERVEVGPGETVRRHELRIGPDVVGADRRAEAGQHAGDVPSDRAAADQTDRRGGELAPLAADPFADLHAGDAIGQVAEAREHQRDGQLCDSAGIGPGRGPHLDAARGGGREVDRIDAGAVPADHPEVARGVENAGRDRLDAGEPAGAAGDQRHQLGLGGLAAGRREHELEAGIGEHREAVAGPRRQRPRRDQDALHAVACTGRPPASSERRSKPGPDVGMSTAKTSAMTRVQPWRK